MLVLRGRSWITGYLEVESVWMPRPDLAIAGVEPGDLRALVDTQVGQFTEPGVREAIRYMQNAGDAAKGYYGGEVEGVRGW